MAARFYLFSLILVVLLFMASCFAQDDAETSPATDDSGTPDGGQDSPEKSNPTDGASQTPDEGDADGVGMYGPSYHDPPTERDNSSDTNCLKCQSIPPNIPCGC